MIEEIKSRQNSVIQYLRSLRDRKIREKEHCCLLEGRNVMQEFLMSRHSLRLLLVSKSQLNDDRDAPLFQELIRRSARSFVVNQSLMDYVTTMEHAPGSIAVMENTLIHRHELKAEGGSFYIVIDGIKDPGNLGTIVRSACAFGATAIVLHGTTVDLFNPKTIRASAGLVLRIPSCRAETQDLASLKKRGLRFLASANNGEKSLLAADFTPPLALILGNESSGISEELLSLSDCTVRVPMEEGIESLNVSIVAALMSFRFFQLNRLG
jgi:RNA methyltransferase, TrmH family